MCTGKDNMESKRSVAVKKRTEGSSTVATGDNDNNDNDNDNNNTTTTTTRMKKKMDDFHWSYTDEPHASRRAEILLKYPEIKKLYGYDPRMRYTTVCLIALQLSMAYYASLPSTALGTFLVLAYVVGGTANHMLMLAMHELAHNLGFKKIRDNKVFGLIANLPVGVPSSVAFKRYHMEHHRYQGQDGIDVDIPTVTEAQYVQSTFMKFCFVWTQVLFYAFRPLVVNPKQPGKWEYANLTLCLVFNTLVVMLMNKWALVYLLLSTFLGSGFHPVAGHFIAEHYVFVKGVETYSYYGILNIFAFNVGYHNEHHDFPFIAGANLPKVREIASEFYDTLPQHTSWVKVIYDYITDPTITAFSRVKRNRMSPDDLNKLKSQ